MCGTKRDIGAGQSVTLDRRVLSWCGQYVSVRDDRRTIDFANKDKPFYWGDDQAKSFNDLKHALVLAPVLRRPKFNTPFEIHTDSSNVAVGACLMQRIESQPHAVAYFSRKLKGPEVRYSATDTEALAVVEGVRAFNVYVYGRSFEVFTDHRLLTYIFKRPTKSARMSRWSHEIASYDCKVTYKPGAAHHVPDLLSRAVAAINLSSISPEQFRDVIGGSTVQGDSRVRGRKSTATCKNTRVPGPI